MTKGNDGALRSRKNRAIFYNAEPKLAGVPICNGCARVCSPFMDYRPSRGGEQTLRPLQLKTRSAAIDGAGSRGFPFHGIEGLKMAYTLEISQNPL